MYFFRKSYSMSTSIPNPDKNLRNLIVMLMDLEMRSREAKSSRFCKWQNYEVVPIFAKV